MEYDIIYGGCAKSNTESYRVMQKAGMVQKLQSHLLISLHELFYPQQPPMKKRHNQNLNLNM